MASIDVKARVAVTGLCDLALLADMEGRPIYVVAVSYHQAQVAARKLIARLSLSKGAVRACSMYDLGARVQGTVVPLVVLWDSAEEARKLASASLEACGAQVLDLEAVRALPR